MIGEPSNIVVMLTNAWQFHVRVGRHNVPLSPEQLPMFMNPAIRRAVVLLESIPIERRRDGVTLVFRRPTAGENVQRVQVQFLDVDAIKNVFRFAYVRGKPETAVQAPLEDVAAVWEARPNNWCIRLSGVVASIDGEYLYY